MPPTHKPLKSFDAPKAQVAKVKKIIADKLRLSWGKSLRNTLENEKKVTKNQQGTWLFDRDYYRNYNPFFRQGLGRFFGRQEAMDIHEAFRIIAAENGSGTKRNPFRILEDGAGHGIGLAGLNEELSRMGITTHTTALTLKTNPQLEKLKQEGAISEIVPGLAEFYIPKKPFDAIISVAGSMTHTPNRITKEHLLKFAYSLKRGGIMLVDFHPGQLYSKNMYSRKNTEKFLSGLENSFRKRGFEAQITFDGQNWRQTNIPIWPKPISTPDMPPYMLIVRRIKG
jgi:hypothetical protein